MAEDRDMSGILFVNDKQGNEKRPDWKGRVQIDGQKYWISAWQKQGQKGPFLSLAVEVPKEQAAPQAPAAPDGPGPIPF